MPQTLQLIITLLAAAVVVVVVCRLVRLPPIVGYLAVGVAVGPHALGLGAGRRRRPAISANSASCS